MVEHWLCPRHCSNYFTQIVYLLIPIILLHRYKEYLQFTDEDTETQRGKICCLSSHTVKKQAGTLPSQMGYWTSVSSHVHNPSSVLKGNHPHLHCLSFQTFSVPTQSLQDNTKARRVRIEGTLKKSLQMYPITYDLLEFLQ